MRNRKLIMTLATPLLVAAPLAIVISCGETKKANTTTSSKTSNTKDAASNGGASNSGDTKQSIDTPTSIVISEPQDRSGITQAEVDPGMWAKMQSQSWAIDWQVYTITMPGTTHKFKFNVEKSLGISKDNVNKLLTKWAKYANWGYSVLTLDNIFVTKENMGSAGWAGQGKDILLAAPADQSNGSMQNLYNTLHHEFGHHETLGLIDGNADQQTNDLIAHNVIGSQMHKNAMANAANEETRLIAEMAKTTPSALLSSIYGVQDPYQTQEGMFNHPANGAPSFVFNANYHLKGGEFLNRAMNVLELMPWDDSDKATLYQFPDTFKYQIGEQGRALYNADGTWTADAHQLVDLYGKYVYGYDGYGLHISLHNIGDDDFGKYELKGFANTEFDFVKIDGTQYNVEHINSHYLTKDKIFAEPTVITAPEAFYAKLPASVAKSVTANAVEFYQDSNHDGKLDDSDKKVEVIYKQ